VSRFQFAADHQDAFEVKQLCAAVQIARSSFYAWQQAAAGRAERAAADAVLAHQIRAVHTTTRPTGRRGSPLSSTTALRRRTGSTTSGSPA